MLPELFLGRSFYSASKRIIFPLHQTVGIFKKHIRSSPIPGFRLRTEEIRDALTDKGEGFSGHYCNPDDFVLEW